MKEVRAFCFFSLFLGTAYSEKPYVESIDNQYWNHPSISRRSASEKSNSVAENKRCKSNSTMRQDTTERLNRLRQRIRHYDLDAYIVTTDDEHQSEYVGNHDKRREYISGFSGSNGEAVILRENLAALWTDSRYFIQAEDQLDCNWLLMKQYAYGTPTIIDWIKDNVPAGRLVGADPNLISQSVWQDWEKQVSAANITLVSNKPNLIDEIWTIATGRDPEPKDPIEAHDMKFAGKSWQEKVKNIREELTKRKVDALLLTDLCEIAWLFNLRGSDIPFVPVFKAYAFVSESEIRLYIKPNRLSTQALEQLNSANCNSSENICEKVKVENYSNFLSDVKAMAKTLQLKVVIPQSASFKVYSSIPKENAVVAKSPLAYMMTIKNAVEQEGMELAMLRDSVVLVDFFSLLEQGISNGETWTEMSAVEKVEQMRKKEEYAKGPSFETISAFGENAALAHYTPHASSNKEINKSNMYVLDSGGQYLDGTSDITRTFHFGEPTEFQKLAYTRVLQGYIDLADAVFPVGSSSSAMEFLARQYLYKDGLDYGHGTGHGVGSYLSVHEYPPLISKPSPRLNDVLKEGMYTSIEPGYYEAGEFGIRLESIFKIVQIETPYRFNNATFLKFQPVVFVPFEPKLTKLDLLTRSQKKWLNAYNAKTLNLVGLKLQKRNNQRAKEWLQSKTPYIDVDGKNAAHATPTTLWTLSLTFAFYTVFTYF